MKVTKCYTLDIEVIQKIEEHRGENNASEYVNEMLKTMFIMLEEVKEDDKNL